ncbi:MAG: chemotaxis response regulator protein-glutamate methylesterase [Candidatus Velthaea sp.]
MSVKRTINVLIVDDSAFMRRAIAKMMEKEDDIEVVGSAASGEEAVALVAKTKPDVITMDVEMPGMGGLEAARTIIERHGPPIIMISALTRDGAETTLRALEIGAVDFIPKPDSAYIDILKVQRDLVEKIRLFGSRTAYLRAMQGQIPTGPPTPAAVLPRTSTTATLPPLTRVPLQFTPPPPSIPVAPLAPRPATVVRVGTYQCVALGTSTGGPVALSQILPRLPKNFPLPIIIVQHMPPGFTRPLADRLNAASQIEVVEGVNGMKLVPGTAIIAPAGMQLRLRRSPPGVEVVLGTDAEKSLHVPSVDIMASAVGETFGAAALGVILTGMGHDGVEGLRVIKARGGFVIGQDEATSVVYGMPRAAAAAGLVDRVVGLEAVARTLCELTGTTYVSPTM